MLTASGGVAGVHVITGRTLTITSGAWDDSESRTLKATGSGSAANNKAGAGIGGDVRRL